MSEEKIFQAFAAFAPTEPVQRRIEQMLIAALDAGPTARESVPSLSSEWLEILRERPVVNSVLAAAAAVALVVSSPLLALPLAFLS